MMVSLHVEDTPLGYTPPFGPAIGLRVSYNERETVQPANLNYTNFGRQWTHNWNGTIKVEETTKAKVVFRGGGMEEHQINPSDPNFVYIHIKSHSRLVKVSATRWERLMPDGSKEVYDALVSPDAEGRGSFWLSSVVDPAGNSVTLQYDANYRLTTITDGINQKTTFHYEVPGDIYKVSRVDDPFGRSAFFSYNAAGELVSVTDVIGLQSQFGYASGDIVNSMTTPYGSTTFTRGQSSPLDRWIEVTDPLGGKERVESKEQAPGIPFEEAPGEYPPIGLGSALITSRSWFTTSISTTAIPSFGTKSRCWMRRGTSRRPPSITFFIARTSTRRLGSWRVSRSRWRIASGTTIPIRFGARSWDQAISPTK